MKIYPEKLQSALQKGLAPVYLLAGDEILLREEAADAIRAAARSAGYTEREVHFAETGFDWNQLRQTSASLSLFAEKRLIEVRLPTGKPGTQGAKALQDYTANLPEDVILLVSSAKPERTPAWVKALESAGVHVPCWPLPPERLPAWIESRLRSRDLMPDAQAVQLIAQRVEGNLLAAAQEIDKLALLLPPKEPLGAQAVATAVTDSARFDVFKCVDAALIGQARR
ncbi:MAG TPA: DNA polymerase III subunit delta, partial [Gammaproteobacteria bacterium]|nr:DNA polymerase III subunit delta [Gammaproteobacteria bacterium]